jgi:nicotinamide phosphoribosyltransferase
MSISKSILFNVDSYKVSMHCQMPPGTTGVYSYIESRGGEYDRTVFFGLQAFIKEYLTVPITQDEINLADEILTAHGEPFNRAGWQHILDQHGGYLPVVIRAVPEGTVVGTKNVLATVENTDPAVPWLTTWLETALLRAVWYPTTVATRSWHIRQTILKYLEETGDPSGIDFKLHDFGARGVSSLESAGIGGAAHLVNFMGTDTISGILYAREYYNAGIAGFSIPAAEHSTITSWGRDGEVDAYRNMLTQFARPGSILAVVSDSYDIYNAAGKLWGEELRQQVIDSGATVVIRPDSGDPVEVNRRLIQILGEKFGYTVNAKGYKVLKYVRIIQGDGVNETSILAILEMLKDGGWSVDNMAFGMGAELGQKVNRDTLKFAMKASAVCINGEWVPISKDPITDPGKRSKTGRVTLYRGHDGSYHSGVEDWPQSALETVYENGRLIRDMTFEQVRKNARG